MVLCMYVCFFPGEKHQKSDDSGFAIISTKVHRVGEKKKGF